MRWKRTRPTRARLHFCRRRFGGVHDTGVDSCNSVLHANTATSALIARGQQPTDDRLEHLGRQRHRQLAWCWTSAAIRTTGERPPCCTARRAACCCRHRSGPRSAPDCLIGHENASVLGNGGDVFVDDDPGFENRGSGRLFGCARTRGRWMSAATTNRAGIVLDLGRQSCARSICRMPNVAGAFDVGAFERRPSAMFANGFE
jgi:hypothetical protein